jgi:hypothetical protein
LPHLSPAARLRQLESEIKGDPVRAEGPGAAATDTVHMNAKTVQFDIPKSEWSEGPWQTEPDREDFEHAGFPCLALRNHHGFWCGYVGVPPGHPAYEQPYDSGQIEIEVHGGLTYAGQCDPPICHTPQPGESDDVWWLGFDCGHARDVIPTMLKFQRQMGFDRNYEIYRDLAYVKAEIRQLADQLRGLAQNS